MSLIAVTWERQRQPNTLTIIEMCCSRVFVLLYSEFIELVTIKRYKTVSIRVSRIEPDPYMTGLNVKISQDKQDSIIHACCLTHWLTADWMNCQMEGWSSLTKIPGKSPSPHLPTPSSAIAIWNPCYITFYLFYLLNFAILCYKHIYSL